MFFGVLNNVVVIMLAEIRQVTLPQIYMIGKRGRCVLVVISCVGVNMTEEMSKATPFAILI